MNKTKVRRNRKSRNRIKGGALADRLPDASPAEIAKVNEQFPSLVKFIGIIRDDILQMLRIQKRRSRPSTNDGSISLSYVKDMFLLATARIRMTTVKGLELNYAKSGLIEYLKSAQNTVSMSASVPGLIITDDEINDIIRNYEEVSLEKHEMDILDKINDKDILIIISEFAGVLKSFSQQFSIEI